MADWITPDLSPAERATLRLRGLYEQFGYKKYQVSQFEEYGFYLKYRSFMTGGRILSFTDLDGRLLALKPDVTLSIAKNARMNGCAEKAYYIENVYRENLSNGTIKEIGQMGLEYIGGAGSYAQAEVLSLAQETLASVGPDYVLEISHMGFLVGLFESLGLDAQLRGEIMRCLSAKSAHGVQAAARSAGVGTVGVNMLTELCALSGSLEKTLAKARGLCLNGKMTAALDELHETIRAVGENPSMRLDFTLQGDMEYYDGLIMAGYLNGAPKAVLSGGRYDGLMKKLGREMSAAGFALYLDDLDRLPRGRKDYDVDALVLADLEADAASLLAAVKALTEKGLRVRVETQPPEKLRYAKCYRFAEGGLSEC